MPFYRERLGDAVADGELTPEAWQRIPVLTHREVQGKFEVLQSEATPEAHGKHHELYTSGSTATPIKVVKTDLTQLFWQALTVRDHLWHRRDSSRKLAVIRLTHGDRAAYPKGRHTRGRGRAIAAIYPNGPAALLDIHSKVHEQAEWLQRQNPDYLLTFPSNLGELIKYCDERGIELPELKQVMTTSEPLDPEVREACRTSWGVGVADMYSAQEVGYMALQCPEHEALHVQAEDVLVEVLDEEGRPCGPGEVGQVVVTPLHNFAMPLIRYAVGDLAEAGEPCPCGRGLPVLGRILGGTDHHFVRLPNGEQQFLSYTGLLKDFDSVVQFQIVRRAKEALEMKLVASRELSAAEAEELRRRVRERFKYPFAVTFTYLDEIPRGPGGKFQYYVH